jgi:exosortase
MASVAQSTQPTSSAIRPFSNGPLAWAVVLFAASVWSYWPSLTDMASRWLADPQYSHGFLVPLFSAYLLWSRRSVLASGPATGRWLGIGLVGIALILRAAGVLLFFGWLEAVSILPGLAGCVTVLAGRKGLRWAYPAILFLLFMIPLPYAVQTAMSWSLQRAATDASTYLLVTLGVPAVAEGNVILLGNDTRLAVVAACSGLGMVVSFLALSTGLALMLTSEPVWARAAVVLSTVPVAVGVNTLRITASGLLYDQSQDEWARWVFHDVAGWLMMPVGLTLFFGLLWVARHTIVPVPTRQRATPIPVFPRPGQ